ncbi:hypothetical protein LOD99_11598 [Oopsacas minuta]|uniref:Uncharacterized protein n=1 Tax=Oopsacas minuta TaxID=111878 RepID=A0AAV7JJX1_9METZ|nr:hypothetical protein LOD99_11598 [Oopsacas minuta]
MVETFSANLSVYIHDPNANITLRGWISQDDDKKIYALVIEIPRSQHEPQGGYFKEVLINDKAYIVTPPRGGNDPHTCECFNNPYFEYYWWMPDAKMVSQPEPKTPTLTCWEAKDGRGALTLCLIPNTSTPKFEFTFHIYPRIHYLDYIAYSAGSTNSTMLKVPSECATTICNNISV